MMHALHNKKNEKILTIISINPTTISSFFNRPNFYGVFFFDKAKGVISIDGQEVVVGDTSILFYYPYQKIVSEGSFNGIFIQFHPDFFCIDIHAKDIGCQGVLFNNFFNDVLLKCSEQEFNELLESCHAIKSELFQKNIGQLDMVSSQLKMFLIKAVRVKTGKQQDVTVKKDNMHHQIEKLIGENYSRQSSPEFYANELEVSLTTFNRLCKKFFQNSFVTILNLKRIAAAKNKLFLTNFPIKDIAYEVGYNDPLYFTRVFKKYSGVSPKDFRKQLKNNRLV